jgi:hypothetical protein
LLSYTYSRVVEFQSPGTSGYMRFISPITSYSDFFMTSGNTTTFWFGLGPGVSEDYAWPTKTYPNAVMKLLAEYGVGGMLFLIYLSYVIFSRRPAWLARAVFVMYALLSGSLLTPQVVVVYYVLLILHPIPVLALGRQQKL